MKRIRIKAGSITAEAELNDSKTASEIYRILPIKARAQRWGEEIYFSIPVKMAEDNAKASVNIGDLGYWPPGNAFCIFFGRTPASTREEIRPASPVNLIGRVLTDLHGFKSVRDGEAVVIEKLDQKK